MLTHFNISYEGWDGDEPSPIRSDVKINLSHKKLLGFEKISSSKKGKNLTEEHKEKIGKNALGKKMSEESKKKLSEKRKGIQFSNTHKENLKKSKLIHKITADEIRDLQKIHTTAKEVAAALGITFHTYKRIAIELGVYKKLDLVDRNKSYGTTILAYLYDSDSPSGKGQFVGEYTSLNDAERQLGVFATAISAVLKGKFKQTKGYYFEKKVES